MCPQEGVLIDEHKYFGRYETYAGASSHDIYVHTGNKRMRQGDISHVDAVKYTSNVDGATTELFPATGLTAYFSDLGISNGHTFREEIPIYNDETKAPVMFEEDWELRPIICGDDLCHKLARLKVAATAFVGTNVTQLQGIGMPYDGLQSTGHMKGPTTNGRPTYVHQPNFLNGDVELLTQKNNSHVEGAEGNGINLYHLKSDSEDPGAFATTSDKYALVDTALIDAQIDDFQSHLDLEPATGLGIRSKVRFGVSHSIWECDPETNDMCKLSRDSSGNGACYETTGDSIFANYANTTKKALLASTGKNDFTYPCSAANVMSPKVVGGKILPMFWYEDERVEVDNAEVEEFTGLAKEYYETFDSFNWVWHIGWIMWFIIGLSMTFRCFLFAPDREWLKPGAVGSADGNNATMTAGTSQQSTTSTTG